MSDAVKIDVEGTEEVKANMRLALQEVQRDVQDVIEKYALLIARDAKQNAPVDTGRLRASIEAILEDLAARVVAGGTEIEGVNVNYAATQEFGTDEMPGKHYLRRAVAKHKAAFVDELKRAMP